MYGFAFFALFLALGWTALDTYQRADMSSRRVPVNQISEFITIESLSFSQLSSLNLYAQKLYYQTTSKSWAFFEVVFSDPLYGLCHASDMVYDPHSELLVFPKGLNVENMQNPLTGQILYATYDLKTREWNISEQQWVLSQ